ncbi:hypothetical protein NECAME_04564 [Necator americanus]|uniref:Uncharacterized protein n=1 Tax=Necator americanus TaxID=51031 RepID=W2SQD1_NECAM|nr:hypothetical protein NECAME_04564 [Necator americanus]ETN71820.1 hypothetical protein NECAME_04564 [Necator americanus]
MRTVIVLLIWCVGVASSASDCLRSSKKQEITTYTLNEPLRKPHKVAMERVMKIYVKMHGNNPFTTLRFANSYTLFLDHFTTITGPGKMYSVESLSVTSSLVPIYCK